MGNGGDKRRRYLFVRIKWPLFLGVLCIQAAALARAVLLTNALRSLETAFGGLPTL